MAGLDRSLIARLALFQGMTPVRAGRDPARRAVVALSQGIGDIRAGSRGAFVLRAARRPYSRRPHHTRRPARSLPVISARARYSGLPRPWAARPIRQARSRRSTASCWSGRMRSGRNCRQVSGVRRQHLQDGGQPAAGDPDAGGRDVDRTGRAAGRACAAAAGRARPGVKPKRASKSISPSRARTSPR